MTRGARIRDLTEQIKRDMAVLAGDPVYFAGQDDPAFYESRIAGCRAEAMRLKAELANMLAFGRRYIDVEGERTPRKVLL